MHWVFLLARVYPYWAIPLTFAFLQFWLFFHRRKELPRYLCALMALLLVAGTVYWFVERGDLHSDQWVRDWLAD